MTLLEAAKQALAALQDFNEQSKPPLGVPLPAEIDAAMETLTKAIEQYESAKPAAWLNLHEGEQSEYVLEWCKDPKCAVSKPLYLGTVTGYKEYPREEVKGPAITFAEPIGPVLDASCLKIEEK